MRNSGKYVVFFCTIFIIHFFSCKKDVHDAENPVIHLDSTETFPTNCDTLYYGETYAIKMQFSDNLELGSFNIDIHHNFNHHSHENEPSFCDVDSMKPPAHPFIYLNTIQIPQGLTVFNTNIFIWFPEIDCCGTLYDEGDYHFVVTLTDKKGLTSQKTIQIKILKP